MRALLVLALFALAFAGRLPTAPEGNPCTFRDVASQKALHENTMSALTIHRKNVQGPASEFEMHELPTPADLSSVSMATTFDINLAPSTTGVSELSYTTLLPVDATERMTVTIVSPIEGDLNIHIQAPSGELMLICCASSQTIEDSFGIGGATFPSTTYIFENPQPGLWKIVITAPAEAVASMDSTNNKHGIVMVGNFSPFAFEVEPTKLEDNVGKTVGVRATLVANNNPSAATSIDLEAFSSIKASLDLVEPDGTAVDIEMHDDGLHDDAEANDGIYGATFSLPLEGYYTARAVVSGTDPSGNTFMRTNDMLFYAVKDTIDVTGDAFAVLDQTTEMVTFYLEVQDISAADEAAPTSYKMYAQVFGTSDAGDEVAVAWMGGISDIETVEGKTVLGLGLNSRWIKNAGVQAPFTLKNIRVQDVGSSDPIDVVSSVVVSKVDDSLATFEPSTDKSAQHIKLEMTHGPVPDHIVDRLTRIGFYDDEVANDCANLYGKLILVHGYCSEGNPWPADQFTNDEVFAGALCESLDHDEFAQRLLAFSETTGLEACATVGHSQGGPAAAHLLTYYWSCIDVGVPCPGQSIQSVGSPYQGTNLAGSIANLGSIFGIGCGQNSDMTLSGAKTWLAGIPQSTRDEVLYYVTQWKSGWFASCSIPVNLVCKWPNDGTTENIYAAFPGAVDGGIKEGWCHTSGMNFPPQYQDATRNSEMDTAAVY